MCNEKIFNKETFKKVIYPENVEKKVEIINLVSRKYSPPVHNKKIVKSVNEKRIQYIVKHVN